MNATPTLDGTALLREIIASPADDLPRLAYADWLEEQDGFHELRRAEFIRWQLRGSKGREWPWTRDVLPPPWHYRTEQVTRKEGSSVCLWYAFVPEAEDEVISPKVTLSRGFVSEAACTYDDWMTYGPEMATTHPIERVVIIDLPLPRAEEVPAYAGMTQAQILTARSVMLLEMARASSPSPT